MIRYIRGPEDVQILEEALLLYKRDFARANRLQDSTISLKTISAISRIGVSLLFELQNNHMPKGFCLKLEAVYVDDNVKLLAYDVCKQLTKYTSKLNDVVQILETVILSDLEWVLHSDEYDLYMFACWKRTSTSQVHSSIQFEQIDLLDNTHLVDMCVACANNCRNRY